MKKTFSAILLLICALAAIIGYWIALKPNFSSDVESGDNFIYIKHDNTSIDSIRNMLIKRGVLKNTFTFSLMARIYRPKEHIKAGAYRIGSGVSNIRFLNNIYKGYQTPIKLNIPSVRLKSQLVTRICKQTNIDSLRLQHLLGDDEFLASYGFDSHNCLAMIIPNTYEVYWTITPEEWFDKMKKEYDRFWDIKGRKAKASKIPLTPIEVSILSSIVDEETNKKHEKPIIAGLYINRLKIGMKLQADPTARYALNDFTINQVLHSYTRIDSPYNTYIYAGLPPGPIRIPSIEAIDAVLNYKHHKYLYMCAKPEMNGEHNFATTYDEHLKYAAEYYKALDNWKQRNNKQ